MTIDRRQFTALLAALGGGSLVTTRALLAEAQAGEVTSESLAAAARLSGVEFSDSERELMLDGLRDLLADYEALRDVPVDNSVVPAVRFDPVPSGSSFTGTQPDRPSEDEGQSIPAEGRAAASMPPEADLPFSSVSELASLLKSRRISSVELTRLYLARLESIGSELECVVTLTPELAMEQAERADRELAAGEARGPLHGVPWGAKDLLAARGYPTTWGAEPYRDQVLEGDAAVVERLERAGAVLVAKLTLGALAWGDVWFGGTTKNPWNPEQGSSGSSAGPAAASAAGLIGFSIGSETWGSIVSPSARCGATGLRPTFGRVSRHGAMALSWSMDKLGPICRSVEDCALVFSAIHGRDDRDATTVGTGFHWNGGEDPSRLRVGYLKADFERSPEEGQEESHRFDLATLATLRSMGVELVSLELPDLPISAMSLILTAEASAAFDELSRSGRDDLLVRQIENAWPNVFRQGRTIPAVEYLQANRVRTLAMQRMAEILEPVDVYVAPSFVGDNLLLTNLTGHPAVVLPNGFREDGTPTSITFGGRLFGEEKLLSLAHAYQSATDFHLWHPEL